jgi:hypothetical protein
MGVKCQSCSHWYPERDILHMGANMTRCLKCQEKHHAALAALSGNPPKSCAECGITFEQLCALTPGQVQPMYFHSKDGCYQMLCPRCDREYMSKRRDMYGEQPVWAQLGL